MIGLIDGRNGRRSRAPQVYWNARGRGSALVLINGYGASAHAWPRGWVRELERRRHVIRLDNRGGGYSRQAEVPFNIADLADDVRDVLDAAEVERASLLGLSMGGMIAQEVALRAPDRVAGLILVATRPPIPAFRPPPLMSGLQLLRPLGPQETLDAHFTRLWSMAAAPGFAERHPEVIEESVRQAVERPTPRAMLVHQVRAMSGWGHAERLTGIAAPTVVVHGREDRFASAANGRALAELIPGARYVELPGVGHLVPQEAPDRLLEAIDAIAPR